MSKKVITRKNLPCRSPFEITLIAIIALHIWPHPGWLTGVVASILVLWWIGFFLCLREEEAVDIFPKKDPYAPFKVKSPDIIKPDKEVN